MNDEKLNSLVDSLVARKAPNGIWDKINNRLNQRDQSLNLIKQFYTCFETGHITSKILSEDFTFSGPTGVLNHGMYLSLFQDLSAQIKRIKIKDIILKNDIACIRYQSINALDLATATTDWLTLNNNQIIKIESYFDASPLTNQMIG